LRVFLRWEKRGRGFYTINHKIFAKTPFVSVKDTVGAGDSFHAGLLHKLAMMDKLKLGQLQKIKEPELQASLKFAMKIAALTCTKTGANPPKIDEI
jgi:Sugar kinases, ribokinase family